MNYIVFDLEWNQSPSGKSKKNNNMPFEIIEIGAVKLNENLEIIDRFQQLVKPKVYKWIHYHIHKVVKLDYNDLKNGDSFSVALEKFLDWCGDEFCFLTWGNQDISELQRNMKFYDMLYLLPGPIYYYNVQKLFSIQYEDKVSRRALEYAVDFLNIKKDMPFHRALSDAYYTGRVFQKIDPNVFLTYYSIDLFQNPKSTKEEFTLNYPNMVKFISKEFDDKLELMKYRKLLNVYCPICHKKARRKLKWLSKNSKGYTSVSKCEEHGYVYGKIRIFKSVSGKYYGLKTETIISETELEEEKKKRNDEKNKNKNKEIQNKPCL